LAARQYASVNDRSLSDKAFAIVGSWLRDIDRVLREGASIFARFLSVTAFAIVSS
jgi:hypothetical protein